MESLSDQQLNRRISTFLERKHLEYPGLQLRDVGEKRARSLSHVVIETLFEHLSRHAPVKRVSSIAFDEA